MMKKFCRIWPEVSVILLPDSYEIVRARGARKGALFHWIDPGCSQRGRGWLELIHCTLFGGVCVEILAAGV